MFSKSLFKQSCKANGTMWLIITLAVCFMLSVVMLISGRGDVSETKEAIENTIIESELKSAIQERALDWYEVADDALIHFDEVFLDEVQTAAMSLVMSGTPQEQAIQMAGAAAYANAAAELQDSYYPELIAEKGCEDGSEEADEIKGIIFYTLNPMQEDGSFMFDEFYEELGETPLHYTDLLADISSSAHAGERDEYVIKQVAPFLAGNLVKDEFVEKIMDLLTDYSVTREQYDEFGYTDYENVKGIAMSAMVNYKADLDYRMENLKEGQTAEDVRAEVRRDAAGSMLATLPEEVSGALEEVGQMDLYGILVGSIFYKMAGLLLPIIYMIMTSNALIAGQVDSGSMAYVLSTSTKRRTVTFTQALYLAGSLLLMFACTTVTSIICLNTVNVKTGLDTQKLLLLNLGAFLVMFAMSGFCFLTSCWFDRSKHAMALGGGLSMFFLVATMLGLFGSPILPSIIRMDKLNYFNYVSLITLFDPISILDGTAGYLVKFGILAAFGLICYIIGGIHFRRKDLPL